MKHSTSRYLAHTFTGAPIAMMKSILITAGTLSVLFFGGIACKKPEAASVPPASVKTMVVKATNAAMATEIIGQLDSPENVQIRARVEGFVEEVVFTEGTNVTAGQTLFLLDKKPFMERLSAAKGALGEAKAALNKYEKDVARLKPLAEKRAIPQQDLEN